MNIRKTIAGLLSALLFAIAAFITYLELTSAAARPWLAVIAFLPGLLVAWLSYFTMTVRASRH